IAKKANARAEWSRGISHDIRPPLSVILGFAGQLEDDESLPAAAREQAAYIRRQGEKLRSLVSDLNLASKLEYSMQPLRMEKVFAVEMARQAVCEFLDGGIDNLYTIDFASDPQSETVFMLGDAALLKRALCNLIQNSITHNPKGCSVSVSVICNESSTFITVADDGVGVSTEKLKELRAKTRHIESTDEKLNLKHGLGILLVWQIVEAHHGTMEITSAPQNGCQTCLTFPNGQK
ncbi:MAG: HAMP domain-containing histidine kinase, partial [Lachnospiraceae bacterium]|nr:HAMP domain-containing histidine kinase [Lachnospiraceae bacterium]